ncbi:GNAT family N-acetyltransferase [Microbacterium sp. 22296]|uniref:GNAT family N-acetyltransferase n=1 Tax=Microbacterium sp. 22296 TaxID=3453903 RepID=UPI003F86CE95
MTLSLSRVDAAARDRDGVIAFLTGNAFPFHVRQRLTAAQVAADIDAGRWGDDRTEAFWIDDDERGRLGLVRLEDLDDPTAMIDLRLAERWRGRGVGAGVLALAAEHAFRTHAGVVRVEGHTREDNVAMRRTFEKSGWVREGWFRDGWPVLGGAPMATVAYAVLRRDGAGGAPTPVPRGPEVTLSGELRCTDDEQADRVRAHLTEHVTLTRAEPGCVAFDVDPTERPGVWRVHERFIDEAAFDAHQRRVATSLWGAATAGVERRYTVRGRHQDAARLVADAWAAEERLLDPAVRGDADDLAGLLANDFTEIGQSGRRWTRADIIDALIAETPNSGPPVIEEREGRPLGPDTVLLTYLLRIDDRRSRRSSVWRCDPRPRCVFHQGTTLPD